MKLSTALLAAVLALALALGGCGGSAKHSSTATSVASSSSTTTTTPSSTTSSSTSTSTTTRTAVTHPVSVTPPPTPSGTPPAPDGLRQTTGYATYELCSSHCSGAVPASLRRALRLPSGCSPASPAGAVKPSPITVPVSSFIGSSWKGARVTWRDSGYSGPVLIRGRQIGGPHAVGFGVGRVPYDELQLYAPGQWQTFTRVRSGGCYAYQVDGSAFSTVIVFKAK